MLILRQISSALHILGGSIQAPECLNRNTAVVPARVGLNHCGVSAGFGKLPKQQGDDHRKDHHNRDHRENDLCCGDPFPFRFHCLWCFPWRLTGVCPVSRRSGARTSAPPGTWLSANWLVVAASNRSPIACRLRVLTRSRRRGSRCSESAGSVAS